jgi:hypothetical protein
MWKSAFEIIAQLSSLLRDVKETREQLATLQNRLEITNENVRALAHKVDLLEQRDTHEREKLRLQLENALLRFEKTLPPARKKT